jgi:hypothetical protein
MLRTRVVKQNVWNVVKASMLQLRMLRLSVWNVPLAFSILAVMPPNVINVLLASSIRTMPQLLASNALWAESRAKTPQLNVTIARKDTLLMWWVVLIAMLVSPVNTKALRDNRSA